MKNLRLRFNGSLVLFITLVLGLFLIRSGKYTIYVDLIYFLILFIFYKIKFNLVSLIYSLYFLFLLLLGVFNLNDFDSILEDIFSFWPLILLFVNSEIKEYFKNNLFNYLASSLFWLLPLSILIFKYMDYGIGSFVTTRFNYNESTNFELFAPIIPILFSPYLIFHFNNFNKFQKLFVILSNLFIFFMGVITLSRSTSINQFFPIILILFHRISLFKINFSTIMKYLIPISLFIYIVFNSNYFKDSELQLAFDGIEVRNELGKDKSDLSTGRFDEAVQYLQQDLNLVEIAFGRGLGGHKVKNKNEAYIGGINMLHFGPLHLFMKGGLILCFIIYIPLIVAIFWFWYTNSYQVSLSLLLFLIGNLITSNWTWGIVTFIFWFNMSTFFDKIKINQSENNLYN